LNRYRVPARLRAVSEGALLPYNLTSMLGIALSALGGAAAASFAGYHSMAPTSQLWGRTLVRSSNPKHLALTYDDGPNDPHTLRLLEVLARHQVRATFFLIGRYVRQRPDIVRELLRAGHVIGNHTFTHPNLIWVSQANLRKQLEDCQRAIEGAVGQRPTLFRPPFGGRRPVTLRVARGLGLQPIMWNATGWDWSAKSAEYIEGKVTRQMRGGDVVLLHDGGHLEFGADRGYTVTATDRLIQRYKGEGREFVTIPEIAVSTQLSAVS
jgi:peptidoglycan-N-acetylglucosamine deacetylase